MTIKKSKKKRSELTADQKKKLPANVVFENSGRPPVGVTPEKVYDYKQIIKDWIKQYSLDSKLLKPAEWMKAGDEFEALDLRETYLKRDASEEARSKKEEEDNEKADKLDAWKNKHLSLYGWERLQANVRQQNYKRGFDKETESKDKAGKRREAKKPILVSLTVHNRLSEYAKSHGLTFDDALKKLLSIKNI